MSAKTLNEQLLDAFNTYGEEGLDALKDQQSDMPVLSHICFKFASLSTYKAYIQAGNEIGTVTHQRFKDKEISWCKLDQALQNGNLRLEWVELVEPKVENATPDGVSSIGYCVPDLKQTIKLQSKDAKILFRYQANHASDMANS